MTERLCKICGGWHDLENWPHNCLPERNWTRSELPGPFVISDTMHGGVQSMLDGKMYDSKSRLRKTYRAAGMVEVGNETPKPFKPPPPDRKAIRESIRKAAARVGFGTP